MATIKVDVVSAEEQIFSGQAKFVALPGEAGELGISGAAVEVVGGAALHDPPGAQHGDLVSQG